MLKKQIFTSITIYVHNGPEVTHMLDTLSKIYYNYNEW